MESFSSRVHTLCMHVESPVHDSVKRFESVGASVRRAETALATLLPLLPKFQSFQREVANLRESVHANHDCDLSCSCRASIASLQREVDRVGADRIIFSDSSERLQTQVTRVESELAEMESRGGVHTSHGPDGSIYCSCRVQLSQHDTHIRQLGMALDELRDCFDLIPQDFCTSDRASSFESTLSSMRSQLDALSPLSSQSFATLQVKVAALEEVYEKWVAGEAVANEEGYEMDGDEDGHIGVRFRSWESDSDGEVKSAAKDRKPPSRWDGVSRGSPSDDPFSDLSWVKGKGASCMQASSYTLDASTMGSYGKGGRPIPSLFKNDSTEATFDMPGITQASVDFPMADFLAAVSQGNDSPEQEPDVKLRGLFGKIGKDRPDVEALDDETRHEVMKILKRPSWDGKQISRPIFERQWQGFHQYWYKRCGSDTLAKILLTALPESLRSLYTQLHLFMGWSYKDIWTDIMKPMKNVSRRMYRKKWRKSQPPQKKTLEAYELWVLEWTLLAQQAAPVTPLEAKEAFTDALHRHGGYQDELDELYKYEELKGVELSHQGAHQLIQYELSWRSNRDVAMEADKGESEADLRQMRRRGTDRNKGNRSRSAPIDFAKVPADACLYCGNKGHRAADCRIKQADQKNGTPGKRGKQWPRKPDNGDRKSGGGKNGSGGGSDRRTGGGTDRRQVGGGNRQEDKQNGGNGAKKGGQRGRNYALEKAAAEAKARLDKGLCVSCGAPDHRFTDCPKLVSQSAQHRNLQGQEATGGNGADAQSPNPNPNPNPQPATS